MVRRKYKQYYYQQPLPLSGPREQVREVYQLLVDRSAPIRHAAAELTAGMLAEQGQRFLAQVLCLASAGVLIDCH